MKNLQLRFLVVIGAQKCGTTSVFEALKTLPNVAPARQKELGFFNSPDKWAFGLQWYLKQWPRDAWRQGRWLLEASTVYTAQQDVDCEWFVGARMREWADRYGATFTLIYCVRDPVARFISAVASAWAQGLFAGDIEDAQNDYRYWGPSCFAKYIKAYRRSGFEPVLVDVTQGEPLTITLDGQTHTVRPSRHNVTSQKASILWQERFFAKHPRTRHLLRSCLPLSSRRRLSGLLTRRPVLPTLTDDQRTRLVSRLLAECGGPDQWGPELPPLGSP